MTIDEVTALLQSKGVGADVIAQEADSLTRYQNEAEIIRLNGPDWFSRMVTRSTRATASGGGVGGDMDLDEDGAFDPGWFMSGYTDDNIRFTRDPAGALANVGGLNARDLNTAVQNVAQTSTASMSSAAPSSSSSSPLVPVGLGLALLKLLGVL